MTSPKGDGGLLRLARRERGFTAQDTAERAGVSTSRVSQVERAEIDGTLQLDTLDRFATALGYRLRYELVPTEAAHPMLASESVGGPYSVDGPDDAGPLSGLDAMIAAGRAVPGTGSLRDLPPPRPLSEEQRAALGGRNVSDLVSEAREERM